MPRVRICALSDHVLIVGAGPAGSVAATVLARAGACVRLPDRAAFPRDKLCGDTVNPGTLAVLRRLGLAAAVEERGLPVHGMRLTGENGVVIEGRYLGVASVPGGLTNVCLVKASRPADPSLHDPASLLRQELTRDPWLRDRFTDARLARPPVLLGPLAVDLQRADMDGLLLAGDASGFIDPITGDGLRFAVRGGELAALAALEALEHGWTGVHARLAAWRRREFGAKWRFNRAVRALVASPRAVDAAALSASIAPGLLRVMIAYAGDCART